MSIETNKAIVLRFNKEVIEQKNVQTFKEIMSPDFINHAAPTGMPKGPEGMISFFENVLWKSLKDITVEIHDQIAEGDKVVTSKTIHGIHVGEFLGVPASNKNIQIHIIDIVRLKNGKYIEHWRSWDPANIITQIKGQ